MLRELFEIFIAVVIILILEKIFGEWPVIIIVTILWLIAWKGGKWK